MPLRQSFWYCVPDGEQGEWTYLQGRQLFQNLHPQSTWIYSQRNNLPLRFKWSLICVDPFSKATRCTDNQTIIKLYVLRGIQTKFLIYMVAVAGYPFCFIRNFKHTSHKYQAVCKAKTNIFPVKLTHTREGLNNPFKPDYVFGFILI